MEPLSQVAISSMADLMGLPESVSKSRLRELAQGHPLATHYLIQALQAASDCNERSQILREGFRYTGDIEELYSSALRGIEGDNDVMDILGLIARAEAPLEPDQIERLYSENAIDLAWKRVQHLLKVSQRGWSIFHNSFRLYVARLPRSRYGLPDPDYSTRLYRRLAEIAEQAIEGSPQKHLRLRYLMRAEAHHEALALATPKLFREQYLAGRSSSNIRDDIRLAFHSLKEARASTEAFRLILSSDEISRRVSSFEDSDDTIEAMLAFDQLEEAESFFDEVGGNGYLIVDAWLSHGNLERARCMFERIEPLHDLGNDAFSSNGPTAMQRELVEWAKRAVHFRTHAEIVAGIDRIVEVSRRDDNPFHEHEHLGRILCESAAFSMLSSNPAEDVESLMKAYRLEPSSRPALRFYSVWQRLLTNSEDDRVAMIGKLVTDGLELEEVPRGFQRGVSLAAARNGEIESAKLISQGLSAPTISEIDASTNFDSVKPITRAVIEHSELVGLLDLPVTSSSLSRKRQLEPLQRFAENAGLIAARTRRTADALQVSDIAQECASFLRYVCRAEAKEGGDYFAVSQLALAAPVVLDSLLSSAARIGHEEFARAVHSIDQVLKDHPVFVDRRIPIEIIVAEAIGRHRHDLDDAQRRLEWLLSYRDQNTPGQFLSSTARLAKAFARIGRPERGHALLAEQRT